MSESETGAMIGERGDKLMTVIELRDVLNKVIEQGRGNSTIIFRDPVYNDFWTVIACDEDTNVEVDNPDDYVVLEGD